MRVIKDTNTEQAILNAAEKLFLDRGFALTSTTAIAKEAGCNQALVHYYFRTKDKLFEALFEKKFRMLVSNFLEIGEEALPFEEKLRKKIESHFEMIRANPKVPFLFFNELTTNPERLDRLKEKISDLPKTVLHQFQKELKIEIENGNIRPVSASDLLLTIISLNVTLFIAGPVYKTLIGISDKDYTRLIEHRKKENVEVIINSLRP